MKKRLKKKLYRKLAGDNPPKWMSYKGMSYHTVMSKPWGGWKEYHRQQAMKSLENFNRVMAERRKRVQSKIQI